MLASYPLLGCLTALLLVPSISPSPRLTSSMIDLDLIGVRNLMIELVYH